MIIAIDESLKIPCFINVINLVDAERSGNNLLSVTGKIKNMKVKCLLDTGAIVSTISRRMANKLNLSKHDTSIKIRTAENNVSQALGVVKNVVIDIRDHKCKMPELVIMDNDYDIILGINYFKAMSAGVIFKNNKTFLKFFKYVTDESDSDDDDLCLFLTRPTSRTGARSSKRCQCCR